MRSPGCSRGLSNSSTHPTSRSPCHRPGATRSDVSPQQCSTGRCRAARRRRSSRRPRATPEAARGRTVDGRLRRDARSGPPGHVPRRRSRRPPCARRARRRGRASPSVGHRGARTPSTTSGRVCRPSIQPEGPQHEPLDHLLDHQLLAKRSRTRLHRHGHAGRPDHHRCVSQWGAGDPLAR